MSLTEIVCGLGGLYVGSVITYLALWRASARWEREAERRWGSERDEQRAFHAERMKALESMLALLSERVYGDDDGDEEPTSEVPLPVSNPRADGPGEA